MIKFLALSLSVSALPMTLNFVPTPSEKPAYGFHLSLPAPASPFAPKKEMNTESVVALKQGSWYSNAIKNIVQSEYQFIWEEKLKAYCTPNRKNNLRFFYDEDGFSVEPRSTKIPVGNFDPKAGIDKAKYRSIPDWKINFDLNKKQFGKGYWKTDQNTATYSTDNISVQYINSEAGMRQNFIVHSPLSYDNELSINFSIRTKLTTYLHGNQLQFFHNKTNVLNYEDLQVWDANHKVLPASVQKNRNHSYCIKVDTKNAVYPITIDPISSTPNSTLDDANQAGASFGTSVSSAGDVNGDGYSDVIIGADQYDDGANTSEGRAFVYYGSASGLSVTPNSILDDANQGGANFGTSVAAAGDVNGDGYSDVIIGANVFNDGANTDEGRAFVYHGSAAGLSASPNSLLDDANQSSANLGYSVACAGDVNGDGYSDVIVGAYLYDDGANSNEGRAFVYHGSAAGLSATPNSTPDDANQASAGFGIAVAGAGDVNGDGYSDVIIGANLYDDAPNGDEGRAFIYHGSAAGLSATPNSTPDDANQVGAQFGISVATAGDINGDGYSEVIIGAWLYDDGANTDEGRAFIYTGSSTGLSASPAFTPDDAGQAGSGFGFSVACAGDVNGDGYSDVIIGAYQYDDGANNGEGRAFIYQGSSLGLSASPAATPGDANQASATFGISVASAGDINGDGYSDVIIGAGTYDDGANIDEGRAFVYHGSANGVSNSPNSTTDDANQANAEFGYSVASAGDVNGDGYSDVIIGAYRYDDGANTDEGRAFVYHGSANGLPATPNSTPDDADQANAQFGVSVASAGDVNGDGYSDVIIGANLYNDSPYGDEGRAFIYHGSAAGLSATPNSTPDDANDAGAKFGVSVASAGDVNGDGYSDVIIGANTYDNQLLNSLSHEGGAFIYHGSATGVAASPNRILIGDQDFCGFGVSAAGAGDVNGDGYSDVIVGADKYDIGASTDQGRAFVYHGSATGLPATPNYTRNDGVSSNNLFGYSVAGAGDVNGDGYSDVIIGDHYYDFVGFLGFLSKGRAFIYHGSATGLAASPNSFFVGGDEWNSFFGISAAGAGDLNGDGYSDVIVGSSKKNDPVSTLNEGWVYVYHGSAAGLSTTPASIPDDADQADAEFGISVASAGDVNGDGYSDVIIGAHLYDDGANTNEGRAFLYNGNDSTSNLRNNLRLYNTDLTTPLNNSNFILGNFGAGLFAKHFLGRDKGKMVWETRMNYNPYSGNPITNSTSFTAQQATYTDLGLNGVELKNLITKILGSRFTKLRARVKYSPATAITGQIYGPWRNVSNIIDANNLGVLPIDLISFNAAWLEKGKTAKLDFKTDKESGVCCFDIEKSGDGFNFYSIGTLPAKNTSGIQSYSFIDANANSKKQFYRIKIKGIAGQLDYSNIQQLQNDKAKEILVFPNPTANVLQLQLNKVYDKMNVQIINASGQLVKQMQVSAPNQIITIPVQNLTAGKYWLYLQSSDERQVLQFVKQ